MNAESGEKAKLNELMNTPIYLLIDTVLNSLIGGEYFDKTQGEDQSITRQPITKFMLRGDYIITLFVKLCNIKLSDISIDKPSTYHIIDLVDWVYDKKLDPIARHKYFFNLQGWLKKSQEENCPDAIKHVSAADILVQTTYLNFNLTSYELLSENEQKLVERLYTIYDFNKGNDHLLIATLWTVVPSVMRLINNFSNLRLNDITLKEAGQKNCWQNTIAKWQSHVQKQDLNAANAVSISSCQALPGSLEAAKQPSPQNERFIYN